MLLFHRFVGLVNDQKSMYPQFAALGKFSAGMVYLISLFQGILSLGRGGRATMKMQRITRATGAPLDRIDGVQKVTGAAKYAYEYPVEGVTYVFPVQSTIAKGRVVSIDARAAQALPGVVAVLSHENAPQLAPLDDAQLAVVPLDPAAYRWA